MNNAGRIILGVISNKLIYSVSSMPTLQRHPFIFPGKSSTEIFHELYSSITFLAQWNNINESYWAWSYTFPNEDTATKSNRKILWKLCSWVLLQLTRRIPFLPHLPAIISARADQIAVIARKSNVSHVSRVSHVSLEGSLETRINKPDISYFVSIPEKIR